MRCEGGRGRADGVQVLSTWAKHSSRKQRQTPSLFPALLSKTVPSQFCLELLKLCCCSCCFYYRCLTFQVARLSSFVVHFPCFNSFFFVCFLLFWGGVLPTGSAVLKAGKSIHRAVNRCQNLEQLFSNDIFHKRAKSVPACTPPTQPDVMNLLSPPLLLGCGFAS